MRRFDPGQAVWVSPRGSGGVIEDIAVILDDVDTGYIILQELELVPSHGMGHFVQDIEVLPMMN